MNLGSLHNKFHRAESNPTRPRQRNMVNSRDCMGGCIEGEPTMKIPSAPSFKTKMVRVMRKRPIVQIDDDEGELIEKDRSHKVIRGGGSGRILKNVFKLKSRNLRYLQ